MDNYQNDTHEDVIFVYICLFLWKKNGGYWLSKLDILSCRAPSSKFQINRGFKKSHWFFSSDKLTRSLKILILFNPVSASVNSWVNCFTKLKRRHTFIFRASKRRGSQTAKKAGNVLFLMPDLLRWINLDWINFQPSNFFSNILWDIFPCFHSCKCTVKIFWKIE